MLMTPRNLILEDRGVKTCQLVNSSTEKKQLNWIEKAGSGCIFIKRESVTFEQQKESKHVRVPGGYEHLLGETHTHLKKKRNQATNIFTINKISS